MTAAFDMIKVLVVDDSEFMRKVISDILKSDNQIQVIGVAKNGEEALLKIKRLCPDVVTLDVEMPVMGGLQCLKEIMNTLPLPVIMLSSISQVERDATIKALENGAFDFVPKPNNLFGAGGEEIRLDLIRKVKAAYASGVTRFRKHLSEIGSTEKAISANPPEKALFPDNKEADRRPEKDMKPISGRERIKKKEFKEHSAEAEDRAEGTKASAITQKPKVLKKLIAIGTSTGGPRSLQEVLRRLPADFPASVFIVQHMPAGFTKSLANRLNEICQITVKEAENNEVAMPGTAYIAPGDYHMVFEKTNDNNIQIKLTQTAPVDGHRPSVNVMMNSLAEMKFNNVIGVIMTGMGSDGCEGLKKLKDCGSNLVIAQSEDSCVVYGMPKAVVQAGIADRILPLEDIANELMKMVGV